MTDNSIDPLPSINDEAIAAGFARWLSQRGLGDVSVSGLARPVAGYSSETIFADASSTKEQVQTVERFVIRTAPEGASTFADYDLLPQFQAQVAASRVGVPVPHPILEMDIGWIGVPFIAMDRIDGHIIGQLASLDPWVGQLSPAQRARIHDEFLRTVAAVHRSDLNDVPAVARRDNEDTLAYWEEYVAWSTAEHPVPVLNDALRWCRLHRPDHEPSATLLWGDVRYENTVFGDDLQIRTVLDWDMTTVGAPEHDLAWLTSLDFTALQLLGVQTEGFPDHDGTVARFEELMGRPVCDLEWYETLAMVRSTAVMTRIGILRLKAGKRPMLPIDDNPILDLLRTRLT
jgi:aminoglycoside phosphotransferase (APT) family kinase protein